MQHATLQTIPDEHAALAAVLRSLVLMMDRGLGDAPGRFLMCCAPYCFTSTMFPERRHPPKESDLLFPLLARVYVVFYLAHMQTEETQLLPVAQQALSADDWVVLDAAFLRERDPLAGGRCDPCYDRLFSRIVLTAPAPIGVGAA